MGTANITGSGSVPDLPALSEKTDLTVGQAACAAAGHADARQLMRRPDPELGGKPPRKPSGRRKASL